MNIETVTINNWKINYMFTPSKDNSHNTPVLLIGGAFQNFHSFKKDVVAICKTHPVFVVELPGQGCNRQLAAELDFTQLAELLKGFCEELNITKSIPIAFSYGSAIGYIFAGKYPHLVEKLLLAGTTPSLRDEVKALLTESIVELKKGNLEEFSKGVVLNLMNYPKRKNIKTASFIVKAMYKNMKSLSENSQQRYIDNTQRLLDMQALPITSPQCPTLVIAGEYDNFTTPEECLAVAKKCQNATFAIIKETDHLAPYEKRNVVNTVISSFINDTRLTTCRDTEIFYDLQTVEFKRHIFNTVSTAFITIDDKENEVPLLALDHYGCHIDLSKISEKVLNGVNAILKIPELNFHLETFLFQNSSDPVKNCFFKLHDFSRFKAIERVLKKKSSFEYTVGF